MASALEQRDLDQITRTALIDAERSESVATVVNTEAVAVAPAHMDRIETADDARKGSELDQDQDQDQHQHQHQDHHDAVETIRDVYHSARRKIYLHHRHDKRVTKQFTAAGVARHLRFPGHGSSHDETLAADTEKQLDHAESHAPSVGQNIWIMLTTFPYWNMAFWSGFCYSIGSAMFVIDGAWAWIPLGWPETEFSGQTKYGVPLWFFFGACLYQVGGVMAYLEAVNDGSFAGAAMKRLLKGNQEVEKELLDAKLHTFFGHIVPHHHHEDEDEEEEDKEQSHGDVDPEAGWRQFTNKDSPEELMAEAKDQVQRRGGVDQGGTATAQGQVLEYVSWRWWPTWHALRTYHIFELGYIACAIQLFGVTLYGVTSVVILPGILSSLQWWQKLAAYWVPQVVASCCFLLAGIMFTIMAQDRWYKPKWNAVSWWIGIWAQVGSLGFLLCAIFGLYSHHHTWAEYQSSLSSTWGSVFYMLSGLFQWYEAINVNVGPVLAFPNNRTPVLLRRTHS